ncbi:MAG TPA: hypothetical protein PKU96_00015 [bacterium]|jgi:hypothetical protein|nr:hypothetical protein [Myxococcales bacterium]OQA59350.1 MAG: hypothetical protein BWY40_01183 [bacterium ADurb.Bin270]HPW44745.1 hypothetical protein [bacterium]HQC50176.1 hypothetical protein [bacterium]HQH79930.1 hypothetical protein [bacterium]
MKQFLAIALATAILAIGSQASAGGSDFPEEGWHKGVYLLATGGMMQMTNDKSLQTNRKFNGTFDPAFGLTFGWDIADWIGPMLQITYATTTAEVGDGGATYPTETARQHAINMGLFARATLPYFTQASWQHNTVKILPYAKLGGVGHAMFVNAPNGNNKQGAYGVGVGMGLGCEFFIWKGLVFAIDATENIILQGSHSRDIAGVSTKILDGGTKFQFQLLGMLGWHF